jgi:hypothetical protein
VEDLRAKHAKLISEAEDCDLISKLAVDEKKRAFFRDLAGQLRSLAGDIEAAIAGRAIISDKD